MIALRHPPCQLCGHREIIWHNQRLGWLCWWCLELCYQSVLADFPLPATPEAQYEEAVDLYCIMAQATNFPGQ